MKIRLASLGLLALGGCSLPLAVNGNYTLDNGTRIDYHAVQIEPDALNAGTLMTVQATSDGVKEPVKAFYADNQTPLDEFFKALGFGASALPWITLGLSQGWF